MDQFSLPEVGQARMLTRLPVPLPYALPVEWYPGVNAVDGLAALSSWVGQVDEVLVAITKRELSARDYTFYTGLLQQLRGLVKIADATDGGRQAWISCDYAIRRLLFVAIQVHRRVVDAGFDDPGADLDSFLFVIFTKHLPRLADEMQLYLGTSYIGVPYLENRWWVWRTVTDRSTPKAATPRPSAPQVYLPNFAGASIRNPLAQPATWFSKFQTLMGRDPKNVIGHEVYVRDLVIPDLDTIALSAWYLERLIGASAQGTNYPGMTWETTAQLHRLFGHIFPYRGMLVANALREAGCTASFLQYPANRWFGLYTADEPTEEGVWRV